MAKTFKSCAVCGRGWRVIWMLFFKGKNKCGLSEDIKRKKFKVKSLHVRP